MRSKVPQLLLRQSRGRREAVQVRPSGKRAWSEKCVAPAAAFAIPRHPFLRYTRGEMYPHSSYHRPRSRASSLFPFLAIIVLGLIVVLVFQIVDYFQEKRREALENKAAVQVVTGRAEMKIWGVPDYTSALTGSILNEGDSIRTGPGSRATLSLLNGSVIRMAAETEVEISALKSHDGQDEAAFLLKSGKIWLKRSASPAVRTAFSVSTKHLQVTSLGTVFSVEQEARESVRVMEGKVKAEVKVADSEDSDMRVAETLEVALGQEVSLSSSDIIDLQNKKQLSLLALLSDEFRDSEWYEWNRAQDASGDTGLKVADVVNNNLQPVLNLPEPPVEPPPQQVLEALTKPVIIKPLEAERVTRGGTVTISGSVSSAAEKIEVTTYLAGKAESYFLQKFKPGSGEWSYVASPEYGNITPGPNRYSIVAVGKDGQRSEPAEISIVYDRPKEPSDLSAPVVTSITAVSAAKPQDEATKVEGKIGKGIVKIFVNDFALTKYLPDSGEWVYFARSAYGNLKEGVNEYAVYGVDYDGKKTPVTKFTIEKKPSESSVPSSPKPAPAPVSREDPVL